MPASSSESKKREARRAAECKTRGKGCALLSDKETSLAARPCLRHTGALASWRTMIGTSCHLELFTSSTSLVLQLQLFEGQSVSFSFNSQRVRASGSCHAPFFPSLAGQRTPFCAATSQPTPLIWGTSYTPGFLQQIFNAIQRVCCHAPVAILELDPVGRSLLLPRAFEGLSLKLGSRSWQGGGSSGPSGHCASLLERRLTDFDDAGAEPPVKQRCGGGWIFLWGTSFEKPDVLNDLLDKAQ